MNIETKIKDGEIIISITGRYEDWSVIKNIVEIACKGATGGHKKSLEEFNKKMGIRPYSEL